MHGHQDIERILLRVPNWIGDAVMSLPALDALKGHFPEADITVLAKPRTMPFYGKNNTSVADVIEYDSKGRHSGIGGKMRLAAELKRRKFQMAVLFQNAFEAALLSYLAAIPERVGYARDLRTPLLTRPVEFTEEIGRRHQVFYYLNIIRELGADVPMEDRPLPRIRVGEDELGRACEILRENGVDPGRDLVIGVAPGASYGPAKRWSTEGFKEVLEPLSKELDATTVIFGGGDDAEICAALSVSLGSRHVNLAGRTTLREFIALASMARLFLTNDSGPMHVAAALGVPTVAVFGSTEPALTGPLGPKVRVVRRKVDCSPCFKRECPYGHYNCMTGVTSADVHAAAVEMLEVV